MMVQSGAWLASEVGVEVNTKWGGAKTFFSGEGLFLLRCTGAGDMLVASYGAITERTLAPGGVPRSTAVTSWRSKRASGIR